MRLFDLPSDVLQHVFSFEREYRGQYSFCGLEVLLLFNRYKTPTRVLRQLVRQKYVWVIVHSDETQLTTCTRAKRPFNPYGRPD